MKFKAHLAKCAEHHLAMAKCCQAAASAHETMHSDTEKAAGGHYHADLRDCMKSMQAEHTSMAEHYVGMAKGLETAWGDDIDDIEISQETRRGSGDVPVGDLSGPGKAAGNPWDESYRKARAGAAIGSQWDPNALQPTSVRAVHGGAPAHLQAIPRHGAPPINHDDGVPEEFRKLTET